MRIKYAVLVGGRELRLQGLVVMLFVSKEKNYLFKIEPVKGYVKGK
jgi:hypothetical protein